MQQLRQLGAAQSDYVKGLFWGLLGVLMFSGGIPATRLAVAELPVLFVGVGRAGVAGLLSLLLLLACRQALPARRYWPGLLVVAFGAVFAYPIFSAIAMQHMAANHGVLVSSVLPLFTAMFGAWLSQQWPRVGFWICALLGTAAVMSYPLLTGSGQIVWADAWLFLACFCCGLSYAQGAILARQLGSWQVICWALVLSLPILLPLCWYLQPNHYAISAASWLGFSYLAVFSMFLGFFAWYKGLALGGVAAISQLQLLTPFLAFGWSALWLGESSNALQWLLAVVVVFAIALGRKLA